MRVIEVEVTDEGENINKRLPLPVPDKTRPFSCSFCSAAFTRAAHLRRHENSHTSEQRFSCRICPLVSTRKDVILRHTRKYHLVSTSTQQREFDHDNEICITGPSQDTHAHAHAPAPSSTDDESGDPEERALHHTPVSATEPMSFEDLGVGHLTGTRRHTLSEIASPELNFLQSSLTLFQGWNAGDDVVMTDPIGQPKDVPNANGDAINGNAPQDQLSVLSRSQIPGNAEPPNQGAAWLDMLELDDYLWSNFNQPSAPYRFSDQGYDQAKANFSRFTKENNLGDDVWFPSKYMVIRFVKAFFEHMAPHLPIVHQPTFDITTTPPPLLYQVMAFGALYLTEKTIAGKLHATGSNLILETQKEALFGVTDSTFSLWVFQTCTLINVFKAYTATSLLDSQALTMFSFTIQQARQGLVEVQKPRSMTYRDWVYEESVSRCLGWSVVLAAIFSSNNREEFVSFPLSIKSFPLASHAFEWQLDESQWLGLTPQPLDNLETFNCILSGQRPSEEVSTFGLLTLTASLLYRICSFETTFTNDRSFLHDAFAARMGGSLEILNDICPLQSDSPEDSGSTRDPLAQCVHALLHMAFYHLYGSQPLHRMKEILLDSSSFSQTSSLCDCVSDLAAPPVGLHKALLRAAEVFRHDCRTGIGYLQKMAPLKFSPLSASPICETALLLTWYCATKPSGQVYVEHNDVVESCLAEARVELRALEVQENCAEAATLPLDTYARLLDENTVWQWPAALARLMREVSDSINNIDQ